MKPFLIAVLLLASFTLTNAEEYTIKQGVAVEEATKALDKYGYSHGNQHGLQWLPQDGEEFIFCKLDFNQTLVLVFSKKAQNIEKLIVVADQKRGKEYPTITPIAVRISKGSFALVFSKKAEQGGVE